MCNRIRNSIVPDPNVTVRIPAAVFDSDTFVDIDLTTLAGDTGEKSGVTLARLESAKKAGREWWLTSVTVGDVICASLYEDGKTGKWLSDFPPGASGCAIRLKNFIGKLGLQVEELDPSTETGANDVFLQITAFLADSDNPCE